MCLQSNTAQIHKIQVFIDIQISLCYHPELSEKE